MASATQGSATEYFTSLFSSSKKFDHNQDIMVQRKRKKELLSFLECRNKLVFFSSVTYSSSRTLLMIWSCVGIQQPTQMVSDIKTHWCCSSAWLLWNLELYVNEVIKTWRFEFRFRGQHHLTVSCRSVFTRPVFCRQILVFHKYLTFWTMFCSYFLELLWRKLNFPHVSSCSQVLRRPGHYSWRTEGRTQLHLQILGDI